MTISSRLFLCFATTAFLLVGCKKTPQQSASAPTHSPTTSPQVAHATPHQQVISINISSEPGSLDPRKVHALSDINLAKMFFEGLTRIGKHNTPALALAEDISPSNDSTTYTIKLRPSCWSNQAPLTAHDFVYAWKSSLDPSFHAPNAPMLYVIKNAAEIKEGKLPASLLGVEVIDDHTLKVDLVSPIPYFLSLLAHPVFFPIHAKNDRLHPQWATQAASFVSNGPFLLVEWSHQHRIQAEKNPWYWDSSHVHLEAIKMVMLPPETGLELFEARELHWEGSPLSIIPSDALASLRKKSRLQQSANLATHFIRVNTESFPLQSQKLRQALAHAINRTELTQNVTQGNEIATTSLVPPVMQLASQFYFEDSSTPQGMNQAVTLLEDDLQERNLTRDALSSIKLLYAQSDSNHRLAHALQMQWEKALDLSVELEAVDAATLFERVSQGQYQLSIGSWYADFDDPINFLEVFKSKSAETNNTNWENNKYKELLEQSYLCPELDQRKKLLCQSEKILIDAMPMIPLYHATMLYVKDNRLTDVVLTPMGTIDFKSAFLSALTEPEQRPTDD